MLENFNYQQETDISKLKKYFLYKENEWKKDKAVLEQKNHLLELQLEDYKLREQNQKKLNDTISQAIAEQSLNQKKSIAEFQKNVDNQQKDQNKVKYKEQIKLLENQVRSLQEQINEKENSSKDMELQFQKQYYIWDQRAHLLEQEKSQVQVENQKLKEQFVKIEESFKQNTQQLKIQYETELQKLKDSNIADNNAKLQDYESKYQQLSLLYENEKQQLQQRISKSQNTIKRYQQHIEQNGNLQSLKQQYEEQIKNIQEQNIQLQTQMQYEKNMLLKQIEDMKKQQQYKEINLKESLSYLDSTKKKRSLDALRIKSSLQSYDSPIMCKSFHIGGDIKIPNNYLKNSSSSTIFTQKMIQQQNNNQSFDKSVKFNDGIPMTVEQFNIIKNKKQKSQSTLSIPTSNNYNLNSYIQEASLFQQNQESFQLDSNNNPKEETFKLKTLKQINPNITLSQIQIDYNKSEKITKQTKQEQYQRSISQEGMQMSMQNLNKMLLQADMNNSTAQKQNNYNNSKVPAFTQNQLNSLKNPSAYLYPCTTLRFNENHIQKTRHNNNHSAHQETKQNKENQHPSKKSKNDIKVLIGKLLQTKGGDITSQKFT